MESRLVASYERCRELHKQHGRSYYLATRLLPAAKRPHVHALYGFTRYADEIVDRTDAGAPADRAAALRDWAGRFEAGLSGEPVDDPILPAVLHTIEACDLDRSDFTTFLRSMTMDLDVHAYATYPDLLRYMEGSAAVIGTMMLPILEPADPAAAREPARQLGLAFQLTNFIRDVAEDLDRGRVYLPQEDLASFGVDSGDLRRAAAEGRATPRIRSLIRFEVSRAREHYALAAPGVPMLAPGSQACIRTAFHVYAAILDEVERLGHDVFARRAVVPTARRLRVAARCLLTPAGTQVVPPVPQPVAVGV
ncbi:phytoene/squalene synthase family protein [Hamadaea tsunoensis]|uniref:phytoene/squalene synthase family protein n=1 Tax=Hamadaea tsunoensis TaxID=53368 RepID=UPI0003F8A1D6|nr:phytoene/squalene synthase family protein [Hamadaea tsunoensis]